MNNSRFGSAFQPAPAVNINTYSAEDRIRFRYDFYLVLLKEYARHSQLIEGKNKEEVLSRVNEMCNVLVEKYRFGNRFVDDLHKYVDQQFHENRKSLQDKMTQEAGLDETSFNSLMGDFKESAFIDKLSPRFKMMLL